MRSAGGIDFWPSSRNYEEKPQVRADASRTVLRGKWEDCSPECPGYDLSGKQIMHQEKNNPSSAHLFRQLLQVILFCYELVLLQSIIN